MWRPSKLTTQQMEERRLEAGRLLLAGELSQAEIARRMGVSARTVSAWARRLRQPDGGLDALRSRPKSGHPSRLTAGQWGEVLEALGQGAARSGFPTERWTLDRVRSLIRERFGVTYHPHYLSEKLGFKRLSPSNDVVAMLQLPAAVTPDSGVFPADKL